MRPSPVQFLIQHGAASTEHFGGTLLVHLKGTEAILRAWEAPETWSRAGLFHAIYGTPSFATRLLEPNAANRTLVASVIGAEAERLSFEYATADKPPHLSAPLLNLAVANAAEQHERLGWDCSVFLKTQADRDDLLPGARRFLLARRGQR